MTFSRTWFIASISAAALIVAGCSGSDSATTNNVPNGTTPAAPAPSPGPPPPAASSGETPYTALAQQSMEEVRLKTEAFEGLFGIGTAAWELDQDTGLITFTSKSGVVATAPVQLAGTFNKADGTWLWAWDNPSIDPKLVTHAQKVQQYGQENNIADLTTAKLTMTEQKALELAALTCKLGGHQGVYRGDSDNTVLMITFGEPTLQQK